VRLTATSAAPPGGPAAGEPGPSPADAALLDRFIDALWIEDGLAALTMREDPVAAERVRAVARSVADEGVRVALERVADGSVQDADVERALRGPSSRAEDDSQG
jgi:hypothetical protein